uniref:Succinylglutamate desuccinylase/aspartoacylase family protein n=1 Tax=Roseihalotalea indica TaxID=2867963 RepID=A0AA49GKV0_9BACT|nr:succinylglutamate desuccinylase/aspartoacylase family protein [Tunicatimonas sp. TK19036]
MPDKPLNPDYKTTSRIIGEIKGNATQPAMVVFAGVHGNEPSGLIALERIFAKLNQRNISLNGSFYGIAANLSAIREQVRYCDEDLNRVFLKQRIEKVREGDASFSVEERELEEILKITDQIRASTNGEIYFIDCHTTSSESIPYISMNEGYEATYQFAKGIAATTVMGVEREIKGCLPEWFNKIGWHGFTFEAGQHLAPEAVESQEAIIWQGLEHAGCLSKDQCPDIFDWAHKVLYAHGEYHDTFYTVISSYRIRPDEEFVMKPGFVNLQKIHRGELLATSNGKPVLSPANAHILMPLYQKQGSFGYFIAEEIEEEYLIFKEM